MQDVKQTLREVIGAVIPVSLVVIILQLTLIRVPAETMLQFLIGVVLVSVGLILFLLGVQLGLLPIGEYIGEALPKAGKLWIIIFFGFLLGFIATIAEPNVRILAMQVDFVSEGVLPTGLLIVGIAIGVAVSVGLAMVRLVFNLPLIYFLLPGYGLAFLLSLLAPEQYIPVSFDAGGVTTGPLIIPFILALGVGVASVMGGKTTSTEGFGLVGLAYIGPVLAVLLMGVIFG